MLAAYVPTTFVDLKMITNPGRADRWRVDHQLLEPDQQLIFYPKQKLGICRHLLWLFSLDITWLLCSDFLCLRWTYSSGSQLSIRFPLESRGTKGCRKYCKKTTVVLPSLIVPNFQSGKNISLHYTKNWITFYWIL